MPTYFHSSFTDKIHDFDWFSHFGDYEAAMMNIGRKIDAGVAACPAYLYEVKIDLLPEEVIDVPEDWGTPRSPGLARALREGNNQSLWDDMEALRVDLIRRKNAGEEFNAYGFEKIHDYLLARNISAIRYPNIVEAYNTDSICVIDPSKVEILRTVCVTAEEASLAVDVYRAKCANGPVVTSYGGKANSQRNMRGSG
jgi:hypothetical protein